MLTHFLRAEASNKPTSNLRDVIYGGGQWVAVGDSGAVWTSSDAKTWTSQSSGKTGNLNGINYTGTTYFACGDAGIIITSTDGITWTDRSVAISENLNNCSVANGVYFITGGSATVGRLYSSTNGTTWTARTLPTAMQRALFDVIYYNNGTTSRYYVVGSASGTQPAYGYSTDYITWTSDQTGLATGGNGRGLFTNGSIVVLGARTTTSFARIASSTDGINFTNRFTGSSTTENLQKGIWTGSSFIITSLGGAIFTSTNGTSWTRTVITTNDLRGIGINGSEIIAVGASGTIGRSVDDGASWTFL